MEKVLFYLPTTIEGMLAAISTVQDYLRYRKYVTERAYQTFEFELSISSINLDLDWLLPALGQYMRVSDQQPNRGEYDLVFQFDEELAYQMSIPTQRHMVQTFGMQLSIDPPILPDLSVVKDEAFDRFPELRSKMIVGQRSGLTYLACCLGKGVVEIYPTDKHKRWLSKWSHPLYAMIYDSNPSPELVSRAVEALWARIPEADFPEFRTQTVLQTCTVGPVVGS